MKRFFPILRYLLSIHLSSILFLSTFRIILFFSNTNHVSETGHNTSFFFQALLRGLQFDNLIASYVMALPLLIWFVSVVMGKWAKELVCFTNGYFIVFNSLLFAINAIDIRYFSYFFSHIDSGAFGWLKFAGTTAGMIFEDFSNYIFIGLFLVLVAIFVALTIQFGKRLKENYPSGYPNVKLLPKILYGIVALGLCFLGIRGSFQRYPLSVSYAYFCDDSFFNQLPVNPTFYLIKSYQHSLKQSNNVNDLMDLKTAMSNAKSFLSIKPSKQMEVGRMVTASGESIHPNIVIVLMESMSKDNLSLQHKGKPLTPYLNQLARTGYFFENFYSAGVHTNNGIVATLYSMPAQFNKPMMQDTRIPHYGGLPEQLQRLGYQTYFFVTGNPQYDSMNSFLRENNIGQVFSIYDYPKEKVVNNFGVQDDYLLQFGVDKLSDINKSGKPFFATFLTVSNHDPIVVPERFRHAGATPKEAIIAFADNAIKEFMEKAKGQKWFSNTIFVFLGDHGAASGKQKYEMPLSYNQIPLIIYSPLLKDMPKRFTQYGGQIDVFPTLMGLINEPYRNNTLGVDLLKEKRPYMFFVNDTELGCISKHYLYVRNILSSKDFFYNLHYKEVRNVYSDTHPDAIDLKKYAVSMMVSANHLKEKSNPR
jgi:phosphoglycerol transferase MdoB-like AlkP superfamily enzyme